MKSQLSERGSTVLEFALISTTLFGLILGLLTFGLVEASDNAGTNAAQEGARAAILDTFCADAYPGSTTYDTTACGGALPAAAYTKITQAVTSRLGGMVIGTPTVRVTCLWGAPSTSPAANPLDPKPCDASIVPDVDLVKVSVTWTTLATNPVAGTTTTTDSATMTIQGSGAGSADTSACLANASVSPSHVSIAGGATQGYLTSSTTVSVITNGYCATPLTINFNTGVTQPSAPMVAQPNGTDFSFTIGATDYAWTAGTYLFSIDDSNNNPITFVAQPQLTVTGTQCQFVSASLQPGAVIISGFTSPGPLSQSVTLTLTTTSGCGPIDATFSPDGMTTQTVTMAGTQPTYTLTIKPGDYGWTPGLKAFSFTDDNAQATLNGANKQAVNLSVSMQCAVTVSLNPDPVGHTNGGNLSSNVTVTATPASGADCSGLTLTYANANAGGSTTAAMVLQTSGVYQYTITKNADSWTVGTWTLTFTATDNPTVATSPSPVTLTVN